MSGSWDPARKRRFKNTLWGGLSRVPAALANPHRLELLDLLAQSARSVQDVAAETNLTVANASQHLRVLAECGLVEAERRGAFVYYRQRSAAVHRLMRAIEAVAESCAPGFSKALGPYIGDRDEGITEIGDLRSAMAGGGVALLDARPRAEFASGHLPGAVNAPTALLRDRSVALLPAKRYLVYCRGQYCTFADEAVALLRAQGVDAVRVEISPADWAAAGGELERD
jgi:DNA-binding transcriptional ArsR family regulator/rhodanese-related sulfurtransferase